MFRSKIVKENNTAYPCIMGRHSLLVYHGSTQPTSGSWFLVATYLHAIARNRDSSHIERKRNVNDWTRVEDT